MVKFTSTGPPAFIANSTAELVNILNATDFDFQLRDVLLIDSDLCKVDGNVRGRGYLFDKECQEHTGITVFQANVNYFATKVFP